MATTFLQTINRVLTALGLADDLVDTSATTITDAYHLKIAQFVNDILEEVETAAQWRALRQRDTATISANGISGSLTNANERSRVWQVVDSNRGQLVPLVFDVSDGNDQRQLWEMDLAELLRRDQANDNAVDGTNPIWFALDQTATGIDVYTYPRVSSAVSLELDMVIPQSRLDPTVEADLDANIKVPVLPVVLGATWWAYEDRGEELGPRGMKAESRYNNTLSDYVARENAAQGFDELVPV